MDRQDHMARERSMSRHPSSGGSVAEAVVSDIAEIIMTALGQDPLNDDLMDAATPLVHREIEALDDEAFYTKFDVVVAAGLVEAAANIFQAAIAAGIASESDIPTDER